MATADRPLTDAQERALIELADLSELDEGRDRARRALGLPTEWFSARRLCRNSSTVSVLKRFGLVETRIRVGTSRAEMQARITDKGRDLLASMGD